MNNLVKKGNDSSSSSTILEAAASGDIALLQTFIDDGVNINHWFDIDHKVTALSCAIECNQVEAVTFLIQNGADVNFYIENKQGEFVSPLELALTMSPEQATTTSLYTVKWIDGSERSKDTNTFFEKPASDTSLNIAGQIYLAGGHSNTISPNDKINMFLNAVVDNDLVLAKQFLSDSDVISFVSADSYATYMTAFHPIYIAIENGHLDMINLLISDGNAPISFDCFMYNINGIFFTPLSYACYLDKQDIANAFIENGATIVANKNAWTYSVDGNLVIDVDLLSPIDAVLTPHVMPPQGPSVTLLESLIENGALENYTFDDNSSIPNLVKTYELGVDAGYVDPLDNTFVKTIEILAENGFDLNAADTMGHTALYYAIESNDVEMFSNLLDISENNDFKLNITGDVLMLANEVGNESILNILNDYACLQDNEMIDSHEIASNSSFFSGLFSEKSETHFENDSDQDNHILIDDVISIESTDNNPLNVLNEHTSEATSINLEACSGDLETHNHIPIYIQCEPLIDEVVIHDCL